MIVYDVVLAVTLDRYVPPHLRGGSAAGRRGTYGGAPPFIGTIISPVVIAYVPLPLPIH